MGSYPKTYDVNVDAFVDIAERNLSAIHNPCAEIHEDNEEYQLSVLRKLFKLQKKTPPKAPPEFYTLRERVEELVVSWDTNRAHALEQLLSGMYRLHQHTPHGMNQCDRTAISFL